MKKTLIDLKILPVHVGSRMHFYPHEIIYIQASANYAFLNLVSGRKQLVSSTLKSLELKLSPFGFLRISSSMLINPKYAEIDDLSGSVAFSDGTHARFSRRRMPGKSPRHKNNKV